MDSITFWHWLIAGVVLIAFEVMAPGVIFMWMGIAAIVTGLILFAIPTMGWEYQLIVFAILSIVSVGGFRMFVRKHPVVDENPNLNRRGQQYTGRTFTLITDIENGVGKASVDDSQWIVHGPDCSSGSKVKVISVEGAVLNVEPCE